MNQTGFNKDVLNSALINTFNSRETPFNESDINRIINEIFTFDRTKEIYENYSRKNYYARNISLFDCEKAVREIYGQITFNKKINLNEYNVELHAIRHGEDDADKIGGWSDNHLTALGVNQVKELAFVIEDNYDVVISSDLNRAKETAIIINEKLKREIRYDERFREVNNGDLKNLPKEEFKNNFSNYIFSRLKMEQSYPNGESPDLFYLRVKDAFIDLIERNKGKKILLVTHGGVITIITCLVDGLRYSNLLKINVPYASIVKFK